MTVPMTAAAFRLAPEDEHALWSSASGAARASGLPVVRRSRDGVGWDVLFVLPDDLGPADPSYLDLNCVTDRSRWRESLLRPLGGTGGPRVAGFRLPDGWRGTYRFHALPGGVGGADDVPLADWAAARRAGTTGAAPADTVWRGAPFSPAAELALPDAPEVAGGPLRPDDPVGYPAVTGGGGDDGPVIRVARIPGGRGTLVVLDGEQFLSFGLVGALGTLARPPATVLAVGSTEDATRPDHLGCDGATRDRVLGAAARLGDGGRVTVAGASLGGAAALWWGLTRPDLVDGVVALSGSFWLRDADGRLLWEASGTDGRTPPVVLGWGSCEVRLAVGCVEAADALVARGVRVTRRSWVGGHDLPHWVGEVVCALDGWAGTSLYK